MLGDKAGIWNEYSEAQALAKRKVAQSTVETVKTAETDDGE